MNNYRNGVMVSNSIQDFNNMYSRKERCQMRALSIGKHALGMVAKTELLFFLKKLIVTEDFSLNRQQVKNVQ